MLTIIDYGTGNLFSIHNMLKYLGISSMISGDPRDIEKAEKLILPGVGHFDFGMRQLVHKNLIPILRERVEDEKIPLLGICLGAQLLTESSEEGSERGLSWIKGKQLPLIGRNYPKVKKYLTWVGAMFTTMKNPSCLEEWRMSLDFTLFIPIIFNLKIRMTACSGLIMATILLPESNMRTY